MTAARRRAEAMARAAARYHGRLSFEEVEPFYRNKLEYDAGELAAALDAYFANTRFVPDGQCGRPQRFKPELIE